MSEEVAAAVSKKAVFAAMAQRISLRTAIPWAVIAKIIEQLLPLILGGCVAKPSSPAEAEALIAKAVAEHPDKCPLWWRGPFRQNGVKDKDDINELWGNIVVDADANSEVVAKAMVA